jgi:hypothetical protein
MDNELKPSRPAKSFFPLETGFPWDDSPYSRPEVCGNKAGTHEQRGSAWNQTQTGQMSQSAMGRHDHGHRTTQSHRIQMNGMESHGRIARVTTTTTESRECFERQHPHTSITARCIVKLGLPEEIHGRETRNPKGTCRNHHRNCRKANDAFRNAQKRRRPPTGRIPPSPHSCRNSRTWHLRTGRP